MPRKRTVSGSIYVQKGRGKLIVKYAGKAVHTGLEDTKEGRKLAQEILEKIYLESKGIGKPATQKIRYGEAFARFLKFRCATKAEKTKRQYVTAFKKIFSEDKLLTKENVQNDTYKYVHETKYTQVTINTYLTCVQVFLNYCIEEKLLESVNVKKAFSIPVETTVQSYTEEEISVLLSYLDTRKPELAIMIRFMLQTGARVVDCLTLTRDCIGTNSIAFRNKITKKKEVVPVSDKALELLRELPEREKVFSWQYTTQSRLVRDLIVAFDATGIERNGRGFQEFRTTFRARLLESGIAPELAMKLMRHSDIRTTMKHYTKIEDSALRNAIEKSVIW
jgi:integrase